MSLKVELEVWDVFSNINQFSNSLILQQQLGEFNYLVTLTAHGYHQTPKVEEGFKDCHVQ